MATQQDYGSIEGHKDDNGNVAIYLPVKKIIGAPVKLIPFFIGFPLTILTQWYVWFIVWLFFFRHFFFNFVSWCKPKLAYIVFNLQQI